jgi:hypothetical protein
MNVKLKAGLVQYASKVCSALSGKEEEEEEERMHDHVYKLKTMRKALT